MATIRESISRIRNLFKGSSQDAFITDRLIYSLIKTSAKALIFRDSLKLNIFKNSSLFKEIPCLELIDVDTIDSCCTGIRTACKIKRSKRKLPTISGLQSGPIVAYVSSLDYSVSVTATTPRLYANMTQSSSFKFNKKKFYWITNDYLYIPNVEWDAVRVMAMFEDDISDLLCGNDNDCAMFQDGELGIPEYLFAEIESNVLNEMSVIAKIPQETSNDNNNILR